MLYKPDWEKVQKRYIEYWACENRDYPILHITAPRDKKVPLPGKRFPNTRDRWLDVEYMLEQAHAGWTLPHWVDTVKRLAHS
jgi:hypothetical protein